MHTWQQILVTCSTHHACTVCARVVRGFGQHKYRRAEITPWLVKPLTSLTLTTHEANAAIPPSQPHASSSTTSSPSPRPSRPSLFPATGPGHPSSCTERHGNNHLLSSISPPLLHVPDSDHPRTTGSTGHSFNIAHPSPSCPPAPLNLSANASHSLSSHSAGVMPPSPRPPKAQSHAGIR